MSKYKIGDNVNFNMGSGSYSCTVASIAGSSTASNVTYVVEGTGFKPSQEMASKYSLDINNRYLIIKESDLD